jgi:hypothetical protein
MRAGCNARHCALWCSPGSERQLRVVGTISLSGQPSPVKSTGKVSPIHLRCSNHSNLKPKKHHIILLLPANGCGGSLQTRWDLHI